MRELTRRNALVGATSLGAVMLAGCVSDEADDGSGSGNGDDGDENGDDGDDTGDDNGTDSGDDNGDDGGDDNGAIDEELELLDTTFESDEGSCSSPTGDTASLEFEGTTLRIEGSSSAPNPCHECVLESAAFEGGSLSLAVSVKSTLDEGEACIECVGEVPYRASCEFSAEVDETTFDAVTVEHKEGETHTLVEAGEVVDRSDSEDDADDSAQEETASVLGYQIQSADHSSSTGSSEVGDSDMEYSHSGDTVTIKGWIITRTPCYDPVIYDASVEGGELVVGVSARHTAEDEVCTQVISKLSYTAEVTLAPETELADVSVAYEEPREMEELGAITVEYAGLS